MTINAILALALAGALAQPKPALPALEIGKAPPDAAAPNRGLAQTRAALQNAPVEQPGANFAAAPTASEPRSPDGILIAPRALAGTREPTSPSGFGGERTGREATLSDRVANYRLEATLDPVKHTIDGKEHLSWRNRSQRPVSSIYFHLYLNAFEGPGSTFNTEKERYGQFRSGVETKKGEWGYLELKKAEQGGRALKFSYLHPDGGPATDRTVVRIDLAEPIAPGATALLDLDFHDQLPRVVARTGYFGSYHLVAQWFPKVGVLELPGERGATEPRWNCHEFHLNSEFYADWGAFDVKVQLPRGFTMGAVGEETEPARETAAGLEHHFVQGDVHDFAFTAWDGYAPPLEGTWQGPGSPLVHVKVLYPPEYRPAAEEALKATIASLGYFSRTLGPYPYKTSTVIVPPFNATESGGMEYETFFTTIGSSGLPDLPLVRYVTVHEFGHGYFMGLLASNEFEEPFLDEGLNEFWDMRMLEGESLQTSFPLLDKIGIRTPKIGFLDFEHLSGTTRNPADSISGNSWDRWSSNSYGQVYARTVMVFHDLEKRLGGDVLARAFKLYYARHHFRHPGTADLRRALTDTAPGQKALIDAWFEDEVFDARPVDDRIETLEAAEILPRAGLQFAVDGKVTELDDDAVQKQIGEKREAFKKEHPKAKETEPGPFPMRSVVQARRYGEEVPQTLLVTYDDGSTETVHWPAGEKWHRWVFDGKTKVASAQLDPDRAVELDLNKLDDGRTRDSSKLASSRWTLEAGAWVQFLFALVGSL